MAGGGSDGEMNYWPGFVDALANLVLALVFVVVIFTLALAVISAKVAKEVVEKEANCQREQAALQGEVSQLRADVSDKTNQLNLMAKAAAAPADAPLSKQAKISGSDIIFTYDPGAFDLGKEALDQLEKLIKSKGGVAGKQFALVANPASGAFSAEKRIAYYRLVTLRNQLIERGVPADSITTRTATDAVLPGLMGQVRLSVGGK